MTEQKTQRFGPISSRVSFPQLEEEVLARWKAEDTFHAVERVRAGAPLFVFYEGPPTANGSPGIHHVLSRSFKDIILRYKTMRGFRPLRRGGWDTHGLPVELEIEKELGLSTKPEIENFGIEEFNRRCRESVFRYVKDWERMTERSGVWLDMDDAYVTYHNSYIETGWAIFKRLWDNGLVYEGFRVTPHCPRCVTSLSSHEVALGYKDDTPDPSVFVRFPIADVPTTTYGASAAVLERLGHANGKWATAKPSFMAWTTTPWTLTANMALAVGPDVTYVLMENGESGERIVLAEALSERVLGDGWQAVGTFKGSELAGIEYEPPFKGPDVANHVHRVLPADYVSTEDGTGIVHTAPAYGGEDAELGKAHGFATVHTVNLRGVIEGPFPGEGKFVKQADKDITRDLQERGLLFKEGTIRHTYPFCWRCGTPLLYYAKASWYIRTTAMKDQMVAGNQGINWYPDHIKEGRFGEWLRNNVDWAVSRERYWGTPIPVWRCDSCDATRCVGSSAELAEHATAATRSLVTDLDLHRPYVDRVELTCECGGTMKRVPEVADAWYDSGAMPFAQWAYPVTVKGDGGKEITLRNMDDLIASEIFPADYITEAVDQTRGWFYSLLALSTLLSGKPSYENVICLGLILDGKGEKMSKSRGNVVNPWTVMEEQGADALRWYLFTSAPSSQPRRFSSDLVGETLRRFMLTLWNTYSFFVTYANLDGFDPDANAGYWRGEVGGPSLSPLLRGTTGGSGSPPSEGGARGGSGIPNELDRWIVSELNELVKDVTEHLENYGPTEAGRRIEDFVDQLSNWYVRRGRRRYWRAMGDAAEGGDEDKTWAYVTLYSCLLTLAKLMAPMTPFVADAMFRNLAPKGSPDSVHLADYPVADASLIDADLDNAVRLAMRVASLGRAARSKGKLKVRQPLARVIVRARAEEAKYLPTISEQVLDELNVKALEVSDDDKLASFKLRPNLPVLGPKYGKQIGAIRAALASADASAVAASLRSEGSATVGGFTLAEDEVLVDVEERPGFAVAIDSAGLMVGLDTDLTPELEAEGMAREIVHRIQNVRKAAGLEIDDRIVAYVDGPSDAVTSAIAAHDAYVRQETLADAIERTAPPSGAYAETQDLDGATITLAVAKA